PVFILGNGPSLDSHIEFIRKHQPYAIIITAGTALGSMAKTGIKPDFHVEMERNINITDWIKLGTTDEYRKGITLLCLNTVAPDPVKLFDSTCIAKKPNDVGQYIIEPLLAGKGIQSLQLCNPTVTNAAFSFAVSMGFKEIYFLGVDLGTKTE